MKTKKTTKNNGNSNPQQALSLLQQSASKLESPSHDLSRADRDSLYNGLRRSPLTAVHKFIELADRHGDVLLGVGFDSAQARADLDEASTLRSIAAVAAGLAKRAKTEALAKSGAWALKATAILVAMRSLSRTPEGQSLRQEYDELRASKPRTRPSRRGAANPSPEQATEQTPVNAPVQVIVANGQS